MGKGYFAGQEATSKTIPFHYHNYCPNVKVLYPAGNKMVKCESVHPNSSFLTAKAQGFRKGRKVHFHAVFGIIPPMLRSAIGLFIKESRQEGKGWQTAIAMVGGCLLLHTSFYLMGLYRDGSHLPPEAYLLVAVFIALAYAWAMASSVYAIEHEKNTFVFLRSLPVSPLTVALGKVGWVICGTVLILACNLLLCTGWFILLDTPPVLRDLVNMLFFLLPCFIEVLVWGIFWSTRCRNTIVAALAAAFSVILSLWVISLIVLPLNLHSVEMTISFLLFRWLVMVFVGFLAAWGALRWFAFSAKEPRRFCPVIGDLARYPQRVQPPFLALIHQHLRHVSLVYPLGVFCFVLFSFGCLLASVFASNNYSVNYSVHDVVHFLRLTIGMGVLVCTTGMLLFWGNIFGHDQRKDSYKFLSRLGVHEGKVWWSRMLPAVLFYFPVLPCWLVYFYAELSWGEFVFVAPIVFTAWFTLLAVGACTSISCSKQMNGIGLTVALGYLFAIWAMFFIISFGSSPLWTTVPVAFAFLLASRLRAGYWLREITTWRSRFIPLVPVFAAALAVLIALPFVRVYSVPYVSWQQIDTYLADAPAPDKEQLLKNYTHQRDFARTIFSGEILEGMDSRNSLYVPYVCLRLMPWEEARRERMLRCQIVAALVDSGAIRDDRAIAIGAFCEQLTNHPAGSGLWDDVWGNTTALRR